MVEAPVYLDDILIMTGWSRRKFYYKLQELRSCGVVMYRYEGRPPRKRICAFPSKIQKWMTIKASKGEII